MHEQLEHSKFVKIHGLLGVFINRLVEPFMKLYCATMKFQKVQYLFTGLDTIILAIGQILLFIIGGVEIIKDSLSIGQFTVALSYFNMTIAAIRYFFGLGKSVQNVKVS